MQIVKKETDVADCKYFSSQAIQKKCYVKFKKKIYISSIIQLLLHNKIIYFNRMRFFTLFFQAWYRMEEYI